MQETKEALANVQQTDQRLDYDEIHRHDEN